MSEQYCCREHAEKQQVLAVWLHQPRGARQAEAGKVKFMSKVAALSTHVSPRFAVWWDDLFIHGEEKIHSHACYTV